MMCLIFGLKQREVEEENSQRWTSWIHIQGNRNRNFFVKEKFQKGRPKSAFKSTVMKWKQRICCSCGSMAAWSRTRWMQTGLNCFSSKAESHRSSMLCCSTRSGSMQFQSPRGQSLTAHLHCFSEPHYLQAKPINQYTAFSYEVISNTCA